MNRKYSRQPRAIADVLQSVAAYHRFESKLKSHALFSSWEEIVGPEIAKAAIPEKITRRSILVLRVIDPVWAQELALQKEAILNKIAERGIGAPINDLQFVAGNPKMARPKARTS